MSDEKESVEIDEIHKNYDVKLTDVDEEYEEIDKITRKEQDGYNQKNQKNNERDQIEISNSLKIIDSQKKGYDGDLVDTDIDRETNDEESEGKDHIEKSKEDNLESDKSETYKRNQREIKNYLKGWIA